MNSKVCMKTVSFYASLRFSHFIQWVLMQSSLYETESVTEGKLGTDENRKKKHKNVLVIYMCTNHQHSIRKTWKTIEAVKH